MKNTSKVWLLFFTLLVISIAASAKTVIDDSVNPAYLFTMASNSGTFDGDTLTLNDAPMVVYFTDRPVRKSGHMSLDKFISMWDKGLDSFKEDPPAAQLSVYNEDRDKHDVFIISRPVLEGDTISFTIKELDEVDDIPKSFGHATLFIDNFRTTGGRIF